MYMKCDHSVNMLEIYSLKLLKCFRIFDFYEIVTYYYEKDLNFNTESFYLDIISQSVKVKITHSYKSCMCMNYRKNLFLSNRK